MTPIDLLAMFRSAGFTFRVEAGKLLVAPASRLGHDEREAIAAHRDGLIAVLTADPACLAVGSAHGPKADWPVKWVL